MNRSQRRTAERLASQSKTSAQTSTHTESTISEAQLAANRANAQHSHGPTSEAGKEKVSYNAVKTGLTGRTILISAHSAPAYEALMLGYQNTFQPVGPEETALVQSLIDLRWRLDSIPGLEYALVQLGRTELALDNPALVAATPDPATLEILIRRRLEREFRNLSLQENRLVSRRERETKELRALQQARKEAAEAQAQEAETASTKPKPVNTSSKNGFVFSTAAQPVPAPQPSEQEDAMAA